MEKMMAIAKEGRNILCHCRGGVGRAGLIACCYLLKCGYTKKYSEAIKIVRAQRSPQAIETRKQEDFIANYSSWLKKWDNNSIIKYLWWNNKLYELSFNIKSWNLYWYIF